MTDEIRDTESIRKRLHLKAFYMMFEMAAVIAVPALAVVGIGTYSNTPRGILILLLVLAFILSWVIIIVRVKRLRKQLKLLDKKIAAEKK